MRQFIIDHLPLVLANWMSIGIGLTDRRGNLGSGLGGAAAAAGGFPDNTTGASEFLIIF